MRLPLRSLIPEAASVSLKERVRSATGALVGVLPTGLVSRVAVGDTASLPVLIAPMGASAVLLFAVPASPLAQPWSILGGNIVGATVGVAAAALVPDLFLACAIAIGLAVAAMMALRCPHPPSGAVALTAVLGGTAVRDLGFGFVLWPVTVNTLLLLAAAVLFNNLTGRRYPHAAAAVPPGTRSSGVSPSDIDAALRSRDGVLDIARDDLAAIIREAQIRASARGAGSVTCSDIMSRDVVAVGPGAPLQEALDLLRRNHIKMLPVTDERARVVGIVTQTDLLDKASWSGLGPRLGLDRRLQLTVRRGRAPAGTVEDIMTRSIEAAHPDTPVGDVVVRMLRGNHHHLPVVGSESRLIGVVSQTDVVSALLAKGAREAA